MIVPVKEGHSKMIALARGSRLLLLVPPVLC